MIVVTLSDGREVAVPVGLLGLVYVTIVLAVIAHSVRHYIASRDNLPPPRLWFQIGKSRRIPPWDWALQIAIFAIGAVILIWLFVPTIR